MLSYTPRRRQQRRKPTPGAARAWILTAQLFDQFGIVMDDANAPFDVGLARGNPRRRLLIGSKGRLGVVFAVHVSLLNGWALAEAIRRANCRATECARAVGDLPSATRQERDDFVGCRNFSARMWWRVRGNPRLPLSAMGE